MLLRYIYEIERKIFIKNYDENYYIDENSAHWKFVKMVWKKKNEILTSINFMESKFDKIETTTREQIEGNDNE